MSTSAALTNVVAKQIAEPSAASAAGPSRRGPACWSPPATASRMPTTITVRPAITRPPTVSPRTIATTAAIAPSVEITVATIETRPSVIARNPRPNAPIRPRPKIAAQARSRPVGSGVPSTSSAIGQSASGAISVLHASAQRMPASRAAGADAYDVIPQASAAARASRIVTPIAASLAAPPWPGRRGRRTSTLGRRWLSSIFITTARRTAHPRSRSTASRPTESATADSLRRPSPSAAGWPSTCAATGVPPGTGRGRSSSTSPTCSRRSMPRASSASTWSATPTAA